jgi:hypothetical protein
VVVVGAEGIAFTFTDGKVETGEGGVTTMEAKTGATGGETELGAEESPSF